MTILMKLQDFSSRLLFGNTFKAFLGLFFLVLPLVFRIKGTVQ
jgi:hypothetical protein